MLTAAEFRQRLKYEHTPAVRAALWYGSGEIYPELGVLGGSVSIDSTRATKRTVSLSILDETGKLIPKSPSDRLAPYGSFLKIYRGIYVNGARWMYPLGQFRIATVDITDESDKGVTIALSGYDQSRTLGLSRLTSAYAIAPGTTVTTAIVNLLSQAAGSLAYSLHTSSTSQLGALRLVDAESNPWEVAQSLATDIGCEIFYDTDGVAVIRDQPDPTVGDPVDSYDSGELSTFAKLSNSLTDDPGYNGVVVVGEAPGLPIYTAERWDDDVRSPTYYRGPYGRRPMFYRSQYIYNQAQAEDTARGLFLTLTGITEQVKFEAVPNPLLDAGDVISIKHEDIGINDRYLVESIELPLDPDQLMSVVCRKRRFS